MQYTEASRCLFYRFHCGRGLARAFRSATVLVDNPVRDYHLLGVFLGSFGHLVDRNHWLCRYVAKDKPST